MMKLQGLFQLPKTVNLELHPITCCSLAAPCSETTKVIQLKSSGAFVILFSTVCHCTGVKALNKIYCFQIQLNECSSCRFQLQSVIFFVALNCNESEDFCDITAMLKTCLNKSMYFHAEHTCFFKEINSQTTFNFIFRKQCMFAKCYVDTTTIQDLNYYQRNPAIKIGYFPPFDFL